MAFVYVDNPPEFQRLLGDLFTDQFMLEHTRFSSFEGFRYSSAVFVNWLSEQMVYNQEVFDNFVQESTSFSSWEEMVRTAADTRF
jgi:hypothetical protein